MDVITSCFGLSWRDEKRNKYWKQGRCIWAGCGWRKQFL